eukprot:768100-Hanusia_phi.AAC.5
MDSFGDTYSEWNHGQEEEEGEGGGGGNIEEGDQVDREMRGRDETRRSIKGGRREQLDGGGKEESGREELELEEPATLTPDCEEIGIGLTGMGLLFTMLGVLLFFDGGLLAVGNSAPVPGRHVIDPWICSNEAFVSCMWQRSGDKEHLHWNRFLKKEKLRGSVLFFLGILLVADYLQKGSGSAWVSLGACLELDVHAFTLYGKYPLRRSGDSLLSSVLQGNLHPNID